MSEYENKTNEELIELLEAKDEEISEFEESDQSIEELMSENQDLQNIVNEYDESLSDREEVSELAFNAGYDACCTGSEQLRGWLNFKIGARI
mgnify:CR=1 FL=1|tara:strand:+ start:264 stop:539 length:276 start_codon:yes stop_codon:yes gene_type:complete